MTAGIAHQIRVVRRLLNEQLHEIAGRNLFLLFVLFLARAPRVYAFQLPLDGEQSITGQRGEVSRRLDLVTPR